MWVDRLIISIGRVPFIAALDAPVVGLKLDERGFVEVDAENRTNLPRVWAIGDLVKGPMLLIRPKKRVWRLQNALQDAKL